MPATVRRVSNSRKQGSDVGAGRRYPSGMAGMRAMGVSTRTVWAAALALLLALRILSPPGFMPSFANGAITITVCPDAETASSPLAHHHDHGHAKLQQHCPYAAGASPATAAETAFVAAALLFAAAVMFRGRAFEHIDSRRPHDRPPSRGPPIPA